MNAMYRIGFTFMAGILAVLFCSPYGLGRIWKFGPKMAVSRHALDVVEHEGNLYAIGGFNGGQKLEVLYSGAKSWTHLAALPKAQEGVAAAVVGDKIYAFGSYGPSDICQIYDINTNSWEKGPVLPTPMYWCTAEAVGSKIYLIPGHQPGTFLNTLYILDTLTNKWTKGASFLEAIIIPASAVLGDQIYLFGDRGRYYKYDIPSDSWSGFTGPPSSHGFAAEAVTVGDRIYLMGGNSGYILEAYTDTEIYDPLTDTWTRGPDLNRGRYQFGAVYLASVKGIYAIGGRDENADSMRSVEILNLILDADAFSLPETGGTINFTLDAGTKNAFRSYFLLGSASGVAPGIKFPTGTTVYLNWDMFSTLVFAGANSPALVGFHDALDGNGQAAAQLNTGGGLPPGYVGSTLFFAYVLYDPIDTSSNPVAIEVVP